MSSDPVLESVCQNGLALSFSSEIHEGNGRQVRLPSISSIFSDIYEGDFHQVRLPSISSFSSEIYEENHRQVRFPSISSVLSEMHEEDLHQVTLPPISFSSENNEANGHKVTLPSISTLLTSPSSSSSSEASGSTSDSRSLSRLDSESDFDSHSVSQSEPESDSDSDSDSDSYSGSDSDSLSDVARQAPPHLPTNVSNPFADLFSSSLIQAQSNNAAGSNVPLNPDESFMEYLQRIKTQISPGNADNVRHGESLPDYFQRINQTTNPPVSNQSATLPSLWDGVAYSNVASPYAVAPTSTAGAIASSSLSMTIDQDFTPTQAVEHSLPSMTLQERLDAFIPKISAANKKLEEEREAGNLEAKNIENVEEDGQYIEMVSGTPN